MVAFVPSMFTATTARKLGAEHESMIDTVRGVGYIA